MLPCFDQVATKLDEKLKRMWKMARSTANTCFSKFAEKKKSVYATVDKYLTPVQKAISGVKDFLAKIKGGELGDFVVGIVQNEVYVNGEREREREREREICTYMYLYSLTMTIFTSMLD